MKVKRQLKILIGVHQFFPEHKTGTEVLTLELARGLRNLGHAVSIITCSIEQKLLYSAKPWLSHYEYDGFAVHRLHYGVSSWHKIAFLELFNNDRITLIKKLILSSKPDIVHFNHLIGFTAGVLPAIRDMGIPVIFTATDFWPVCPAYTLYRRFEKSVCMPPVKPHDCLKCLMPISSGTARLAIHIGKTPIHKASIKGQALNALGKRPQKITQLIGAANTIFVSTEFLKNILIRGGFNENSIRVVRYGVDIGYLPEFMPIPPMFSEKHPLLIGFIGTLSEKKGAHVIINALTKRKEKNVKLLIFGKYEDNDPYCKLLIEMSQQLGDTVRFKGTFPHENIGEVLRGIHILSVPSVWYESSPLVLTSALNAHVPLIVSDLGGLTEMIHDGDYGFSFPPGNADFFSKLISKIKDKPEIIINIRKNMSSIKRTTLDYAKEIESEYFKLLT